MTIPFTHELGCFSPNSHTERSRRAGLIRSASEPRTLRPTEAQRIHLEVAALNSARSSDALSLPPPSQSTNCNQDSKPSMDLLQEQIQHNYQEFEEMARRKACQRAAGGNAFCSFDGLSRPTHEVDVDFESVFLEQSEDEAWSFNTESSDENVDMTVDD